MSIYEIKLEARAALHEEMQRTGFCYSEDGSFRVVNVRVHTEFALLGDVKGTSFIYAQRQDTQDKLIFLNAQYQPKRGDVVTFTEEEKYRVDSTAPPYNITTDGLVVTLPKGERANYPAPPAAVVYTPMRGYLATSEMVAI